MPMIQTDDGVRTARGGDGPRARRCCSCMNSRAIIAAGSRRFAAAQSALSLHHFLRPADTHRPTCPMIPTRTPKPRAVADAVAVLDAVGSEAERTSSAFSMGGFTAVHLAMLAYPDRLLSAVVAGAGYGCAARAARNSSGASARPSRRRSSPKAPAQVAQRYAVGPARVQFQNKNPRGWAQFAAALGEHSATGSALTMRGVQGARPSLYGLTERSRGDQRAGAHHCRRRGRGLPGAGA